MLWLERSSREEATAAAEGGSFSLQVYSASVVIVIVKNINADVAQKQPKES